MVPDLGQEVVSEHGEIKLPHNGGHQGMNVDLIAVHGYLLKGGVFIEKKMNSHQKKKQKTKQTIRSSGGGGLLCLGGLLDIRLENDRRSGESPSSCWDHRPRGPVNHVADRHHPGAKSLSSKPFDLVGRPWGERE